MKNHMNIEINPAVFQKLHRQFKLVCVIARGLKNDKAKDSLHLLQEAERLARLTFHPETIKNHYLIAPWAVAQQEFGKEAHHYHTSVEHLLKDVLHHRNIETQTAISNIVRYLSLKYFIPLSVDDLAALHGDISFTLAQGREKAGLFHTLKKGDFYYRDAKAILGAKLDYWKNQKTSPAPETTDALIHLEILPPVTAEMQDTIVSELVSLIEAFCSGKTKVIVLDKKKKKTKI